MLYVFSCFSDCKLTYSPEVGGSLVDYIGKDNFDRLLSEADKMFEELGYIKDINDDYEIVCWDVVSQPSTPMAWIDMEEEGIKVVKKYEMRRGK